MKDIFKRKGTLLKVDAVEIADELPRDIFTLLRSFRITNYRQSMG